MNEPGRSVTVKLEAPTAMDCMVAAEPDTFSVTPPTDRIALVERLTSLYAARASPGRSKAAIELESKNFFTPSEMEPDSPTKMILCCVSIRLDFGSRQYRLLAISNGVHEHSLQVDNPTSLATVQVIGNLSITRLRQIATMNKF